MRVDRIIRNERKTIEDILFALDHRLTAAENFAPEGTLGHALISNGPGSPPSYQPIPGAEGGVTLEQVLELLGSHTHDGAAIVSGQVQPQFLGSGARDGTRFLRDDGTWQVVSAGSVAWGSITGIPTDFAGYGLDDDLSTALGAFFAYDEFTFTTASLAQDAIEAFDTTDWGHSGIITRVRVASVNASNKCWVRVYGSAAHRTADESSGRAETADPDIEVSVAADLLFTPTFLDLDCAPVIPYANQEHGGTDETMILTVTNKGSGGAQVYAVTVTIIRLTPP